MATLEVTEGRKVQSTDEQIAYTIDVSNVGSSPTSPTAKAYDLTTGYNEVTSTVLSGSCSVTGNVITTPTVKSLTAGHLYRVEVQFTVSGSVFEHYFEILAEKGARAGMSWLVQRLRYMIDDSDGEDFTDSELQDVLDGHRVNIHREQLEIERTLLTSDDYEYRIYHSRHENLERVESGTAVFKLEDSAGAQRGTATYSADYLAGIITMTADQEGTALYLTARSYDLNGAASEVWERKAGSVADRYSFSAGGQSLSRSDWFDHCMRISRSYARKARPQTVHMWQVGDFDQG